MPTIKVFSTKHDDYFKVFIKKARVLGYKCQGYLYEKLSFYDNKFTYLGRKEFPKFTADDCVLFRRCIYEKKKQHFWIKLLAILARDAGARVVNSQMMTAFPIYSGKLFQAAYFAHHNIPHVPTFRLSRKIKQKKFPLIIKKRLGAFGQDSYLANDESEFISFKNKHKKNLDNYIVQAFSPLKRDIRVLIVANQVLGSVERKVNLKENKSVTVKVTKPIKLIRKEEKIVQDLTKLLPLDMAGLDLFTDKNDNTWLGEINFFPNFNSFISLTGKDVYKQILNAALGK